MSKEVIKEDHKNLPTTFFGYINTCLFLIYALLQPGTGAIGDSFPKKYVLAISFSLQAFLFIFVGLLGTLSSDLSKQLVPFCILFGLIGAI